MNFKGLRSIAFMLVLAVFSTSAMADKTRNARSGDVASQYTLETDGDFFRTVNGNKCQITNKVEDFKISMHPSDKAVVYFIREESNSSSSYETYNLYVLHNASRTGQCPKASKKKIVSDVAYVDGKFKYNVVSNTNTTIVNVALNANGQFTAWDNNQVVLTQNNVEDYTLHNKFGVSGAPFSSYVVFAINDDGYVLKVKGKTPSSSKWDRGTQYSDLADFKRSNRIQ